MNRFWKCFLLINIISISAVWAQDKLIPKPVPTVPIQKKEGYKILDKVSPLLPPKEYVYFDHSYKLEVYEHEDVHAVCKSKFDKAKTALGVGLRFNACSTTFEDASGNKTRCVVDMPLQRLVPAIKWEALAMHELAHCNGWKHE